MDPVVATPHPSSLGDHDAWLNLIQELEIGGDDNVRGVTKSALWKSGRIRGLGLTGGEKALSEFLLSCCTETDTSSGSPVQPYCQNGGDPTLALAGRPQKRMFRLVSSPSLSWMRLPFDHTAVIACAGGSKYTPVKFPHVPVSLDALKLRDHLKPDLIVFTATAETIDALFEAARSSSPLILVPSLGNAKFVSSALRGGIECVTDLVRNRVLRAPMYDPVHSKESGRATVLVVPAPELPAYQAAVNEVNSTDPMTLYVVGYELYNREIQAGFGVARLASMCLAMALGVPSFWFSDDHTCASLPAGQSLDTLDLEYSMCDLVTFTHLARVDVTAAPDSRVEAVPITGDLGAVGPHQSFACCLMRLKKFMDQAGTSTPSAPTTVQTEGRFPPFLGFLPGFTSSKEDFAFYALMARSGFTVEQPDPVAVFSKGELKTDVTETPSPVPRVLPSTASLIQFNVGDVTLFTRVSELYPGDAKVPKYADLAVCSLMHQAVVTSPKHVNLKPLFTYPTLWYRFQKP